MCGGASPRKFRKPSINNWILLRKSEEIPGNPDGINQKQMRR
jgi:hypothetical protein